MCGQFFLLFLYFSILANGKESLESMTKVRFIKGTCWHYSNFLHQVDTLFRLIPPLSLNKLARSKAWSLLLLLQKQLSTWANKLRLR